MPIRPLLPTDRSEWLRLLKALHPDFPEFDHVPTVDAFIAGTPLPELMPAEVFVYERDGGGGLGGFLELSVRIYAEGCSGPVPYIEAWYVDPDLRQRGIGRQLVEAAEDWARRRGHREMASDALLENRLSHEAHGALGFEEVERIVTFRKSL